MFLNIVVVPIYNEQQVVHIFEVLVRIDEVFLLNYFKSLKKLGNKSLNTSVKSCRKKYFWSIPLQKLY